MIDFDAQRLLVSGFSTVKRKQRFCFASLKKLRWLRMMSAD